MDLDVYTENYYGSRTPDLADPEYIVNLGLVAAKIAYYNFQWRFATLVVYCTLVRVGVESFLTTYNQSIYLKYGKWLPVHRVHVPQFVVFGQETAELLDTLQWLVQAKYDNTAKYVIICANPKGCEENEIFQTFFNFYMPNVMFIRAVENNTEPTVFTYDPLLPGKCRNNKPVRVTLSNCHNDLCYENMYPDKLGNLHKCPFIVSTLEQPPFMYLNKGENGSLEATGADGDVIKVLSEIMNGTLVIKTPDEDEWGYFQNNNWTGSFGDIFNERAHASLCAAPLTPELHGNFQISHTYATLDMVWAARLPQLKPSFEKLFYPLKPATRLALGIMFAFVIVINVFMKTQLWRDVRNVLNIGSTNVSLFFYSTFVFLGMPLVRLPSKGTLRTIVVSWILFCYIIRTAYQAALVSTMKLQLYEDYLENFQDVIKNKYPYGGLGSLRGHYSEDPQVIANWVYIKLSNAYDVLDSLLNGTSDFVIALNKEYIVQYVMKYNGTAHVQIIPEKIVNSPAVLYFKRYAPLRVPVSRALTTMLESGIVDMLYSKNLNLGDKMFFLKVNEEYAPLSLAQISSSIAILFFGWIISIIYFVTEVIAKKLEKRNARDTSRQPDTA